MTQQNLKTRMSAVEMKDSGVEWLGEIPSHWDVVPLREVAVNLYSGATPSTSKPELWNGDIPWVTSAYIGQDTYLSAAAGKITEEGLRNSPTPLIPRGNLLIGTRVGVGKAAINVLNTAISQDLTGLIIKRTKVDALFLVYMIRSEYCQAQILPHARGSTIQGITRADLVRVTLPLPPLHEQRAIASYLDAETARIDKLIAKTERLNELLREKRTALISRAVTKGLDPAAPLKDSGVEWLGEIPRNWEVKRLKHVAAVRTSNVDKKTVDTEDEVSLLNYTDAYYNEYITDDIDFMRATANAQQIKLFQLRKGDVIVTKDSETWDDIAVPACIAQELPGVVCGYHLALIRPFSKQLCGKYLARQFASTPGSYQFKVGANGVTRFGLSQKVLRDSLFLVPPLHEQRAIADHLDTETARIDRLISKNDQLIALLREKRTALISAAVTGKISVPSVEPGTSC